MQILTACGSRLEVSGVPAVLAFCPRWPPAFGGEALRAELRGLGAVLVLASPGRAVLLGADDEPRLVADGAALWKQHGVRESGALTILLLDERGAVRLRRDLAEQVALEPALLAALRAARKGIGRRDLFVSALAAGLAAALLQACAAAKPPRAQAQPANDGQLDLTLRVNGEDRKLRLEPRVTLLDALREQLGLTGAKKGCDMGQCGACTVLIDGVRVNSCLQLAVQNEGRQITTIEGLARGDDLHPMQQAFLDEDGLQCGYCTPGQILSAIGLLGEGAPRDDDDIRERMSGNLCRCGAYPNIVAAVKAAQARS